MSHGSLVEHCLLILVYLTQSLTNKDKRFHTRTVSGDVFTVFINSHSQVSQMIQTKTIFLVTALAALGAVGVTTAIMSSATPAHAQQGQGVNNGNSPCDAFRERLWPLHN